MQGDRRERQRAADKRRREKINADPELRAEHLRKKAEYMREWTKANPEKAAAIARRSAERLKIDRTAKNAYFREYRRKNPHITGRDVERTREWRRANPEAARELSRRSYWKNREARAAAAKIYYEAHPDKILWAIARALIAKETGLASRAIPCELIEARTHLILLRRLLRDPLTCGG